MLSLIGRPVKIHSNVFYSIKKVLFKGEINFEISPFNIINSVDLIFVLNVFFEYFIIAVFLEHLPFQVNNHLK